MTLLTTLESTLGAAGEGGLGSVQVQESGPSEESHRALGESLRSGETNRTQEETL
jgi:hypothetical protein